MTQLRAGKTAERRAEPDGREPSAESIEKKPGRRIVLPDTGAVPGDQMATRPQPMGHRVLDER